MKAKERYVKRIRENNLLNNDAGLEEGLGRNKDKEYQDIFGLDEEKRTRDECNVRSIVDPEQKDETLPAISS